jgi:hypothetical protein
MIDGRIVPLSSTLALAFTRKQLRQPMRDLVLFAECRSRP